MPYPGVGDSWDPDVRPPMPAVVPRAHRPFEASALPIDQWISPMLRPAARGLICITGHPGSGKSTAVRHLRDKFSATPAVRIFDADERDEAKRAAADSLAIVVDETAVFSPETLAVFELANWSLDDCVEYLMKRHRDQARSVLDRLRSDECFATLDGSPELLAYVMDQMASDATLASCRQACLRIVASIPVEGQAKIDLEKSCMQLLCLIPLKWATESLTLPDFSVLPLRLARHAAVQRMIIAEGVRTLLVSGTIPPPLMGMNLVSIIPEIVACIADEPKAITTLQQLLVDHPLHDAVPMAASILLAANPEWRPYTGRPLNLVRAALHGAKWAKIDLQGSNLVGVDLTKSDLVEAKVNGVRALNARLDGADLTKACCDDALFDRTSFAEAKVTKASFVNASLNHSDFTFADLAYADFTDAKMKEVTLRGVNARFAKFESADLRDAELDDAFFTGASFSRVTISNANFQKTNLHNARFTGAILLACNFEGLEIIGIDFTRANLTKSLFTGSRIHHGQLESANLTDTGLADIEWKNVNLRGAILIRASFHLGSTRSGMVGSTIPCEGSRTGFYTDEFDAQLYKTPEEIRKACLVGAELYGAVVSHTDFYLVDLREAHYSKLQRSHFVRCRAILDSQQE